MLRKDTQECVFRSLCGLRREAPLASPDRALTYCNTEQAQQGIGNAPLSIGPSILNFSIRPDSLPKATRRVVEALSRSVM